MTLKLLDLKKVTVLGKAILSLVIGLASVPTFAAASTSQNNKINKKLVMSADQVLKIEEPSQLEPHIVLVLARSTNLTDFKDGSRKDGMDYLAIPSLTTRFGSFSAKISYSQDLKDDSTSASTFNDIPVTYALPANQWEWSSPYILTLTPTVTVLAPVADATIKRDQLQTAISAGISFGVIPDGIAPKRDGAWNFALGVTAGRNFHSYEEDINGKVLNKYSSNQTVNVGYTYKLISFGVEYIHKSRWSYQDGTREAYELTQELGYSFNDNIGAAIGHSNSGSALKDNGFESNFEVINENSSTVYGQLAVSF